MSKGGGRSSTNTIQKADPWVGQQGYLTDLYRGAQALPQREFFPGSTVVPFSPETEQALDLTTQRALGGSPVTAAGQGQLASTLRGDYLYGGPGFNRAFEAARGTITPMVQGQFERAGRFGGGLAREAETRALGDAFAGLYDRERQRQMAGLGFVPQMAAQDYQDIGALAGVGAQREALQREQIAEDVARHEFAQMEPYERLQAQSGIIQAGFPGGMTSTQEPLYRNRLAGALGGGAAGFGLGSALGIAPTLAPVFEGGALLSAGGLNPAMLPFALGGALLGGLLS